MTQPYNIASTTNLQHPYMTTQQPGNNMSQLPPTIIKIKRKATDEPLDYLRIHEGKRQRMGADFVFSRQASPNTSAKSPNNTLAPAGPRRIKPLRHTASSSLLRGAHSPPLLPFTPDTPLPELQRPIIPPQPTSAQSSRPSTSSRPGTPLDVDAEGIAIKKPRRVEKAVEVKQPRRFHISRSTTASNPLGPKSHGSIRKHKAEPTVFVERKVRAKGTANGGAASNATTNTPAPTTPGEVPHINQDVSPTPPKEAPRPRKRPGLASRRGSPPQRTASPAPATIPTVTLPTGTLVEWNVKNNDLVQAMQAYTMEAIGKNLAAMQVSAPPVVAPTPQKVMKGNFKPKVPTGRYGDRHPESKVANGDNMDVDFPEETYSESGSDDDYVIDTYIRVPAQDMDIDPTSTTPSNVGLLIIESDLDRTEFYREEEESDSEEADDEEDENAENHYGADYPEDEVDSDDEFDRNAYKFSTRNEASDDEDWDGTYSDDEENGSTMRPWDKKPWLVKKKSILDDESEDEDEDEVVEDGEGGEGGDKDPWKGIRPFLVKKRSILDADYVDEEDEEGRQEEMLA